MLPSTVSSRLSVKEAHATRKSTVPEIQNNLLKIFFYDVYEWPQINERQDREWDIIHGWFLSGGGHVAACGTRWHVAYLLFSVINEGEEMDAPATQAYV